MQNQKTKIIATIGPSCSQLETIIELIKAGVNVFRINFSHSTREEQIQKINLIKQARAKLKQTTSLLLDTKGPEIRVGKLKNNLVKITKGKKIRILTSLDAFENHLGDEQEFSISFALDQDIKVGDKILIDDGKLITIVERIEQATIFVEAINNHYLASNKRINVPGVDLSLPFLAKRDLLDIKAGIDAEVNYVAASFVNNQENIFELRQFLEANNASHIKIIAKIESTQAIKKIDEIISACDGIMIARGDLGLEIPAQDVPYWEKIIIKKAHQQGKFVNVATQMLDSMEHAPTPTRAEVTDVYFASELGADATMLSGETANGEYPIEATKIMKTINAKAIQDFYNGNYHQEHLTTFCQSQISLQSKIACQVVQRLTEIDYKFIVVLSRTGKLLTEIIKLKLNVTIIGLINQTNMIQSFGIDASVFIPWDSRLLFNKVKEDYGVSKQVVQQYTTKKGEKFLLVENHNLIELKT